jgi:hypothetical protein
VAYGCHPCYELSLSTVYTIDIRWPLSYTFDMEISWEHLPPPQPESDVRRPETLVDSVEKLLPELALLGEQTDDTSRKRTAWTEYAKIREQIVDNPDVTSQDIEPRTKMQLAFVIHRAFIFEQAGHTSRYIGELDHAITVACSKGFDPLASTLQNELDAILDTSELTPEIFIAKLHDKLNPLHRETLRDGLETGDDLETLIASARAMLLRAGEDPEAVFNQLGIT